MGHLIKKILLIIISVFMSILILFIFIFYRRDLSVEDLEDYYFTSYSNYIDVSIRNLDDQTISINLHYQDYGDINSEVIVLLHGAFASSHTFNPWALELVELGYRVISIDLPYHGLSGAFLDHITSLRRSAMAVKAILDELDISEVIIGGNSMGGGVSWFFAATYHQKDDFLVKGLVLIDSIYPMEYNEQNRIPEFLTSDFFSSILSKFTPRFLLKSILNNVYGSYSKPSDETIDRYYDLLRKEGNRKAILINEQEMFSIDEGLALLEYIRITNIPVLIIWGREDSWIPVEVSSLFKEKLQLPDEFIIIYDDLGHVPMEEDPSRTLLDLLDFIHQLA
jgi:pimeloyl-ACP methyl ester carboxylesterase